MTLARRIIAPEVVTSIAAVLYPNLVTISSVAETRGSQGSVVFGALTAVYADVRAVIVPMSEREAQMSGYISHDQMWRISLGGWYEDVEIDHVVTDEDGMQYHIVGFKHDPTRIVTNLTVARRNPEGALAP